MVELAVVVGKLIVLTLKVVEVVAERKSRDRRLTAANSCVVWCGRRQNQLAAACHHEECQRFLKGGAKK